MKATVCLIVLSIVLLSLAVLGGESADQTGRTEMPDLIQIHDTVFRGSKAVTPGLISYQGTLTDTNGVALNTVVSVTFSIYTDSTGGAQVWTETQPLVEVNDGLFNVLLGRVNAIPDMVFEDPERWLGVQVESDPELEPRQRMAAVAYAFRASEADTADFARTPAPSDGDWTISGNHMYSAVPGSVGIGIATPDAKLHVVGGNIAVSDAGAETGIKIAESWITDPYDGALHIQSGGNRVTFDGSDNVGIGTAAPSAKLDVSGDINADSLYKIKGTTVLSIPGTENVFVGPGAGTDNTGIYGTFMGYNAGYQNSGDYCTFIGDYAGYLNQGLDNTFIGTGAGPNNTSGRDNAFLGCSAGGNNSTGELNTFLGSGAGHHNITGNYNTCLGTDAGMFNSTGSYNTYLGAVAGRNNTGSDSNNVFVGCGAGFLDGGSNNVLVGYDAGFSGPGSNNIFIGYQSGYSETGSNKLYIANGSDTSDVLIYGDFSNGKIGIGTLSPGSMLDVSGDINADFLYKIGEHTVLAIPDTNNVFVGVGAGVNNTGPYANYGTFIGDSTGHNNQGFDNTLLGYRAGYSNTTGSYNTFLGSHAGLGNQSGDGNTCVGLSTGLFNTAGQNNTFLGAYAGFFTMGSNNVFLGYRAGIWETGSNKLYIANDEDSSAVLIYGDFSTGRVGIGTLSPGYKLDVDGDINTTGEIRQGGFAYNFPDYVFEPDYELMPLAELEGFVAENKHLPGMPSAEEVKKEGVKLFEQNRLLVEKLEEAYLYILQLQERISKLEDRAEVKLSTNR